MAQKPKPPKMLKIKIGSVSDLAIALTQKQDGAQLTFRAGQIGVLASMPEGCRVYPPGQATAYFDVKESAQVVNAMVDACYRAAAQGFYEAPEPPPPAKPNRADRRAAAANAK